MCLSPWLYWCIVDSGGLSPDEVLAVGGIVGLVGEALYTVQIVAESALKEKEQKGL